MSDPMLDDLPPDLLALLARESEAYPVDASLKSAVLTGVETAVGALGGGGGGDGGDGSGTGGPSAGDAVASAVSQSLGVRALVAIATGAFLAGGVVGGVVVNRATAPVESTTTVGVVASASVLPDHASDAGSPVASERDVQAPATTPIASSAAVTVAAVPAREAADTRGDLTRERELLDAARASLSRSNPNDAIAAAERHAQRWPRGFLVEEREVVWIQALAAAGRRTEADRKASQFRRSFPKSVLAPAVDSAVQPDENRSTP